MALLALCSLKGLSLVAGFNTKQNIGSDMLRSYSIQADRSGSQQRQFYSGSRLPTATSAGVKLNLYNPNNPSIVGARSTKGSISSLFAVPEIERWRILDGGSVQGFVKNHPTIPNGDVITTSPLKAPNAVGARMIVTTSSGTKYKLLDPLNKEVKGGTVTVSKRSSGPRKTPSLNVQGNIPIIDDWKVLGNDSVQGFVFNHPVIPDGQVIKTSTLKNARAAKQAATVNTISGSKYRLGEPEGFVAPATKAPSKPIASPAFAPQKKSSSPPKKSGGLFSFFGSSPSPAPAASKNSPTPAPAKKSPVKKVAKVAKPADNKVAALKAEKEKEKELKTRRSLAQREYGLTGEALGEGGKYLLSGQPIKSTSGKSLIFRAYRGDADGLPIGQVEEDAVTIKVSSNQVALEREASNYNAIAKKGFSRGQFVDLYEYLPADELKSTSKRTSQSALVLERGAQDLKVYLAQKRADGGLSGKKLREAAAAAAQCVQAAHQSRLVWTDMKTENFVVTANEEFKGIDLESAIPFGDSPVDYSPEACPPEFAKAFLAGDGPYFTLDPSYDIWSLGMMCYEMATGFGYFDNKSPIQITRALSQLEEIVIDDDLELDGRMRSLIESCLQVDPKKRPSISQVLVHPYFLTTGIGPFSF